MRPDDSDYLFVTRSLRPEGGEEALAAWCLQQLLARGTVTVVTFSEPDLAGLDKMAGTSLDGAPLRVARGTFSWLYRLLRWGVPARLLCFRLFVAQARRMRRRGQVCVSVGADLDLGDGSEVWQYLGTLPRHHSCRLREANLANRGPLGALLARFNLALCDLLARWDDERAAQAFTVVASQWVGQDFQRLYGRPADRVLYPPALGRTDPSEANKAWSFVSLGRGHPAKAWRQMIEVVHRLRQRGHAVGFTMLVLSSDRSFLQELRQTAAQHSEWLTLEVDAPRERLDQALQEHHFGLHLARGESYGMSVAEMLLAGCLTGVSASGGQQEVVLEEELRFSDVDDAVEKWDRILGDPDLHRRLRHSQQARRSLYTRERFQVGFAEVLSDFESALQARR